MINSLTVTNHLDESCEIDLRNPAKSGFLISKIEGLGPTKAAINMSDISNMDGNTFNSARVGTRNIVITLSYADDISVEDSRHKSYKYFPVKKQIKLKFETDTRSCEIYGYVESNEVSIFSSKETAVISVLCPNPYFYSLTKNLTDFSSVFPEFEFPFSNESLTERMMVISSVTLATEKSIYYSGDSEVGISILIHAGGVVSNLRIVNKTTRETMTIDDTKLIAFTGSGIKAGDDILISTIRGNKSITLMRDGLSINILNCLDKNTKWFQLNQGDNVFAYTADSGILNFQFEIMNDVLYGGI